MARVIQTGDGAVVPSGSSIRQMAMHRVLLFLRLTPMVAHARFRAMERRDVREAVRVELWLISGFVTIDSLVFALMSPRLLTVSLLGTVALAAVWLASIRFGRQRPQAIALAVGLMITARMAAVWLIEPAFAWLIFGYLLTVVVAAAMFVPWNPRWHFAWLAAATVPLAAGVVSEVQAANQIQIMLAGLAAITGSAAGNQLVTRRRERTWRQEQMLRAQGSQLRRAQLRLEVAADEDALTGLLNRRRLERDITHIERRAKTAGYMAVLMVDIDHFKQYNDRAGHLAGDQALQAVAAAVRRAARGGDRVYRYGGEEIVVIAEVGSPGGAHSLGRRIISEVRRLRIPQPGEQHLLTASVGLALASSQGEWRFEALLVAADRAMYRAKESGRDRLEVAPGLPGDVPVALPAAAGAAAL